MADVDRRHNNYRGGGSFHNRKRRYRGRRLCWTWTRALLTDVDDDDYDRRPQRRRHEEPINIKLRKQLLGLAESVRIFPSNLLSQK